MLRYSKSFEAIGTHWSIETDVMLSDNLIASIDARIEQFDKTYSRFRKDSLVSRIATQQGTYLFPEDANTLFMFYENLYVATQGKVTPLIGGVLERAGYDAAYSFVPKKQKKVPLFDEVIERDGVAVTVKEPVLLDVGAAGKGYLVDLVCALLDAAGIEEYVVNASGDLRHKGKKQNRVGLEDPFRPGNVIGVIDVRNESLCASATSRRKWGNGLHHIFDPDTMKPADDIVATWVVADSAMIADGLATALFFTEPHLLRKAFAYEYVRLHADGVIDYSTMFEGKLFF